MLYECKHKEAPRREVSHSELAKKPEILAWEPAFTRRSGKPTTLKRESARGLVRNTGHVGGEIGRNIALSGQETRWINTRPLVTHFKVQMRTG